MPISTAGSIPGTPRLELGFTGFLRTQPDGAAYGSIAAGIDRVFASTHGEVGLFLKDGGLVERVTQAEFFRTVLPYGQGLTDPRVSYDYESDRFFAIAASGKWGTGCEPDDCPNTWTVAVSKASSPQSLGPNDWHYWAFDATLTEGSPSGLWGDFSIVASNGTLLLINGQMVREHPRPKESVYDRLWVFDKAAFLAGEPVSHPAREFYGIADPKTGEVLHQRLIPATNVDDPGGIFLVHFGMQDCDIIVVKVSTDTSRLASEALFAVQNVAVPGQTCRANTIPAAQLGDGPSLYVHPHITSAPVYQGGSLWIAQAVPAELPSGLVNGVRMLRLDVSRWPAEPTVEEDILLAEGGVSYGYPALTVNRAGDAAVVLNRLSPNSYVSVYYTGRLWSDPAGAFRPAVPLMPGKAYHDYPHSPPDLLRLGGYSGAALDPADGSAWLIGQYAERPCIWGERIAHVAFVEGGAPATPPAPTPNGGGTPCPNTVESPY